MWYRHLFLVFALLFSLHSTAQEPYAGISWMHVQPELIQELQFPEQISALYTDNGQQLIWVDGQTSALFESGLNLLARSEISPFFTHRYKMLMALKGQSHLFEYDLLATDTFINYLGYVEGTGKNGIDWFYGQGTDKGVFMPDLSVSKAKQAFQENFLSLC